MSDCKPAATPMAVDVKLVKDDGSKPVDQTTYQSIVGSLLYAATSTRPDISHAVGVLSKFCSAPTETHLTAAKRVLRYLKGTSEYGIRYTRTDKQPIAYSDASWAETEGRHSTSGVVFMHCDGPISWLSKQQSVVALSTAEAEYIAAYEATKEAAWLRQLYQGIENAPTSPIVLHIDNQSAINIANKSETSKRCKHMDIKFHYVRQEIANNHIITKHCYTESMVADILTKSLSRDRFVKLRDMLGVVS